MFFSARDRWRPRIARLWSVLFLAVGLSLLFYPTGMMHFLNRLAEWLRLSGKITIVPFSLDHILALSLMGTITLLADQLARHPERRELLWLLVAAKLFSTAGFLVLTFTTGSAWLLGALADAAVALSLWFVRRHS